jgi:hemolysin activation/secretion protein
VIGGLFSVRGYPQSAAVGDTVVIASAEYRFHLPRSLPVSGQPLKLPRVGRFRVAPQQVYGRPDWDLILRGFVDGGYTIRNPSSLAPLESNETLFSAGIGLELRIRHNLTIRVDWARALSSLSSSASEPVSKGNNEFHFLFSLVY